MPLPGEGGWWSGKATGALEPDTRADSLLSNGLVPWDSAAVGSDFPGNGTQTRPRARRVLPLHVSSSWLPSVSPDFSLLFLVCLLVLSWSPHPHAPLSLPLLSSSRSSSHLMSHPVSSCSSGPLLASALRRVRTGLPHLPRGPLTHWSPPPEYFSCRDVE